MCLPVISVSLLPNGPLQVRKLSHVLLATAGQRGNTVNICSLLNSPLRHPCLSRWNSVRLRKTKATHPSPLPANK